MVSYEEVRMCALKDKRFRRKWEVEVQIRLQKQKGCKYCSVGFGKKIRPVLHHAGMDKFLNKIEGNSDEEFKKVVEYYKSLKDTDLICGTCHGKEHLYPDARGTQLRLKRWINL